MPRLYLVDDQRLVREALKTLLLNAGHEVIGEADEPVAALRDIAAAQPDVVLLELLLGPASGFELLAGLAARGLRVPVLVVTADARPQRVAQAMQAGAAGYLLKRQATGRTLSQALADVVAGRRALQPAEAALADEGRLALRPPPPLSPREQQILALVCRGWSSAAIGEGLHLSPKTVDTYRSRSMNKLGLPHVPALVRWAVREGLVELDED